MDLSVGLPPAAAISASAPKAGSTAKRLDAIKLAKGSRWDELKRLVDAEPPTAQQTDSYGMLPLHWACTEPHSIGEGVLMALLKANPAGARVVNTAEMLPLQIAIKAQAKIEWLQALLASYPDAVLKKTPTGEHAVELARKAGLPPRSVRLLEEMYLHVCQKAGYSSDHLYEHDALNADDSYAAELPAASRGDSAVMAMNKAKAKAKANVNVGGQQRSSRRPSHPDAYKMRSYSDNDFQQDAMAGYRPTNVESMQQPSYARGVSTSSTGSGGGGGGGQGGGGGAGAPVAKPLPYQMSTKLSSRTVVSLPPRWMNAPNCHICSQKWSTFRKRHHCRNCGQSICGDHSARERMRLPHYGLPDKYRVCTVCHHSLRTAGAEMLQPSHAARLTHSTSMQARRSDEVLQRISVGQLSTGSSSLSGGAGAGGHVQLERHVSAPARPMDNYHGIHDQVASLQMQVSQLLEQKEQAESQLRAQAELLGESYPLNDGRLTTGSNGSGSGSGSGGGSTRRDRLNSVPLKLPSSDSGYSRGSSQHGYGSYGSYDMNARLTRSTESSDREVEIDYGALSMSSAVPEPPTSSESGTAADVMARLQEDIGSMSFVSSYSEFDDRSTEMFDDEPSSSFSGHQGVLEEGEEEDESDREDDDDGDEGDSTLPEVEVLVNLGLSMLNKGSCSAAVQAFTRAVEICPDTAVLYSYLAKAHYADDNLDDAVASLEKSLELEPSAANSTLLGKILFEKGDHEKAIEAYQKSLEYQNASSSPSS